MTCITRRSARQRARQRELSRLRKIEIEAGRTDCECVFSPDCNGRFEGWQHKQNKSQGGTD